MKRAEKFTLIKNEVSNHIKCDETVNIRLPNSGRIYIERGLPYLCVYRKPTTYADPGTVKLITGVSSYLVCSNHRQYQAEIVLLVQAVATAMHERFGACLILEIWAGSPCEDNILTQENLKPSLKFFYRKGQRKSALLLSEFFKNMNLIGGNAEITTRQRKNCCSAKSTPLRNQDASQIDLIGIEVSPVYRDQQTGELFPQVLRKLTRQFTMAMQKSLFDYMQKNTTHCPPHFYSIGRKKTENQVWQVDNKLAEFSDNLELLLNVTPVNVEDAWKEFKVSKYKCSPLFFYRPLTKDPLVLKRELYAIPVEKIEDPAFSILFRDKMEELDRQITLLEDRGTSNFMHESIQLYDTVDDELLSLAKEILSYPISKKSSKGESITSYEFAELAKKLIQSYQLLVDDSSISVEVRNDVSGILVSKGKLLIGEKYTVRKSRVNALLQHEVGTHILTYLNGRSQRFKQLYSGLKGYDSLQEGIAVFNEYLVGGLDNQRLRILAARVMAVYFMTKGAGFSECFSILTTSYGFTKQISFGITMRVYRSGGFTKDAIYLLGLKNVFDYVNFGGNIDELYIGKIAMSHLPLVNELRYRGVLIPPPLLPLFLQDDTVRNRINAVRNGFSILDILKTS